MSSLLEQQFRAKWSLWAALGAGCLVGMSGMVLLQRLQMRIEASQPQNMSKELSGLHMTLKELQEEIRQIKTKPPLKSALRNPTVSFSAIEDTVSEELRITSSSNSGSASAGSNTTFHTASSTPAGSTEFFSAISSDDEDDQFYDLEGDDGDVTPTNDPDLDGGDLAAPKASGIMKVKATANGGSGSEMNGNDTHFVTAERLSCKIKQLQDEENKHLTFFVEIDHLMESSSEGQKQALTSLRKVREMYAGNAEFLWRLCKSMYLVAVRLGEEGASAKKQELIFGAVDVGAEAIECDDNSSESHKWYAIAVGIRGEYLGIKEKILDGFEFKKHISRASELAPKDHTIQHLLGRFCYEVAELSWWERKMASTLFADPPQATMEEARDHFMAAEDLKPDGWKENRQFLAKTFIHLKDYKTALQWLDKANQIPVRNPDDQQAQNDVEDLLKIYESYR